MRVFDDILDVLSDGAYHKFEEVKFKVSRNLNETEVKFALSFLQSYGFVLYDQKLGVVKLEGCMATFLKRLKACEMKGC